KTNKQTHKQQQNTDGRDGTVLSEMEWMSQALLRVDPTDTGELVEITVFGQPGVKTRVKNIIQSLAVWFRELLACLPAKKIKRLEEFLKASSPYPETTQHPVEYKQDGNN
uniref:KH-like RNA-binding domain-containing protein n=1 Tax=Urocitellus parryii TaxID=9999 RepID=A0A8D2HLE7_UROPR